MLTGRLSRTRGAQSSPPPKPHAAAPSRGSGPVWTGGSQAPLTAEETGAGPSRMLQPLVQDTRPGSSPGHRTTLQERTVYLTFSCPIIYVLLSTKTYMAFKNVKYTRREKVCLDSDIT